MTFDIVDATMQQLVDEGTPLVVDFWAPWCGPCKMMLPIIDELATEYEGKIRVGKVNVDENPDVCEQFGIMNIPTLLLFKNGELVERHVGAARKADLEKLLDELV